MVRDKQSQTDVVGGRKVIRKLAAKHAPRAKKNCSKLDV